MVALMTAVMTGIGTSATMAFSSALTTALWNSGCCLARAQRIRSAAPATEEVAR